MRSLRHSTFGLVAIVGLVFALATLAIGATVYEVAHEALEEQLDHRISTETSSLLSEAGNGGSAALADAIARREAATSSASLNYLLVDKAGLRIAGSLDARVPDAPGYEEHLGYDRDKRMAQALTTVLADGGRLLVAADREALEETDTTIQLLTAAAFGAMLLLGVAGAWTVGAITRARLRGINRTALAIIDGELSLRMPVNGSNSEFDRVAVTLNQMLDRIAGLLDNLRQVSSNVAHDLRTPLTRLNNRLDEALISKDPGLQRRAIEAALEQSRELLDIFAALLRISEVEALSVRGYFSDLSLSTLVTDVVETYAPDAESSGHRLVTSIAPAVRVSGDRHLLQQLLTNLLDNALRHTPSGTTIQVSLATTTLGVSLTVQDDGPGVPANELPTLFRRFSRPAANRLAESHGLGLALVSAIAAAHYGSATVESVGGLRISILLPGVP